LNFFKFNRVSIQVNKTHVGDFLFSLGNKNK
jgi:hypothetical protein